MNVYSLLLLYHVQFPIKSVVIVLLLTQDIASKSFNNYSRKSGLKKKTWLMWEQKESVLKANSAEHYPIATQRTRPNIAH